MFPFLMPMPFPAYPPEGGAAGDVGEAGAGAGTAGEGAAADVSSGDLQQLGTVEGLTAERMQSKTLAVEFLCVATATRLFKMVLVGIRGPHWTKRLTRA